MLTTGELREALLHEDGARAVECVKGIQACVASLQSEIDRAVIGYCREGGFPEVWALPDPVRKIEYLMEQQVRKVLYEDLMMLTSYRKPENVLRFFVYLLGNPGREINIKKTAQEAGVERRVVEENLPRLELTDLIMRIRRFSRQPLSVRQGNMKCYPVDMALRNAVLKTWELPDEQTMGLYAENLVLREMTTWPEKIEISYYRERNKEVDFVLTHGGNRYLPIEVKHRGRVDPPRGLRHFMRRHRLKFGVVITREAEARWDELLYLPLRYFLLAA